MLFRPPLLFLTVLALLISCLFHCLMIYMELGTPLGLLTPPLLFLVTCAATKRTSKWVVLHLFPFAFFLGCHVVLISLYYFEQFDPSHRGLYYQWYFIAMQLSLFLYPLISLRRLKTSNIGPTATEQYISRICFISLGIGVFMITLTFRLVVAQTDFGFDPNIVIYGCMGLTIILTIHYLLWEYPQESGVRNAIRATEEEVDQLVVFQNHDLTSKLYETKLYLDPDLSLNSFAAKLAIRPQELTFILNHELGINFYQLVARSRINYACQLLLENKFQTLEALAYDCGFNSKTTFNKYFKHYTGMVPSEYRNKYASSKKTNHA